MTHRTIGVVVPVHRAEEEIADCIRSIAAQRRRPDRVVLVDDRGGDRTMAVAERTARSVGLAIHVVVQPANGGPSAARNAGLGVLDTELVWFCDADDSADPDFLSSLHDAMVETGAPMAMCRTARVDGRGRVLSIDEQPYVGAAMDAVEFAARLLVGDVRGYSCNKLLRRDLLGERPFPEGVAYEDLAPMLRAALAARTVALVDAPHYRYLVNDSSLSRGFGPHVPDLFAQEREVVDLLAPFSAGPGSRRWGRLLTHYRYDGVLLPAANMALRARSAGTGDPALVEDTVARVRSQIRLRDLPVLWRAGARRQAVAAAVLRVSPGFYRRILDHR